MNKMQPEMVHAGKKMIRQAWSTLQERMGLVSNINGSLFQDMSYMACKPYSH